ncbi:DUF5719 family protein [Zhihengliuella salsuginis]|uniref:Secreted protein n=1 Tax=Zhihengliuella salsuginis TaxID=578222 RepID=A0ABQ3GJF5_9MICC|nr:DUF5719 family protein [Zhihengliuella salsuginis]GHD09671.1 hypothetical protein GCM10008096_22570 [Zhihengliuella salsuginis]
MSDAPEQTTSRAAQRGPEVVEGRRARRAQRRRIQKILAGSVGAVLVLGAGGGVAAAGIFGVPSAAGDLGITRSEVPAGEAVFSCPPVPRVVEGSTAEGTDPQFAADSESAESALRAAVVSDAAERLPGSAITTLEGEDIERLAPQIDPAEAEEAAGASADGYSGQRATVRSGVDEPDWAVLRAQPLGGLKSLAGQSRAYQAEDGDLAGFAASTCRPPSNDQWITGASTEVGRTGLLMLANPSASAATVNLDVVGSTGRADAGNLRGIVLGPGQTKNIVLAGFIADDPSVSVRVRSTGAPVNAVVQQSVLRGLTPGGVEYLEAGESAGPAQVVPGVMVPEESNLPADDVADARPELQITNPGSREAEVNVRIFRTSGEVDVPGGATVTVPADSVATLPLDGLGEGSYTVALQSDESVVAGARSVRGTEESGLDFGWAASAKRLGNQHLLAVPQLAPVHLVFGSAGGASEVTLRPIAADGGIGEASTIVLDGATTRTFALDDLEPDAVAVLIDASGEAVFGAQLVLASGNGISIPSIPRASEGQRSIAVDVTR